MTAPLGDRREGGNPHERVVDDRRPANRPLSHPRSGPARLRSRCPVRGARACPAYRRSDRRRRVRCHRSAIGASKGRHGCSGQPGVAGHYGYGRTTGPCRIVPSSRRRSPARNTSTGSRRRATPTSWDCSSSMPEDCQLGSSASSCGMDKPPSTSRSMPALVGEGGAGRSSNGVPLAPQRSSHAPRDLVAIVRADNHRASIPVGLRTSRLQSWHVYCRG
jgi:hypothetical protein